MLKKFKWRKEFKIASFVSILIVILGLSMSKHQRRICQKLSIIIENDQEYNFLDKQDIQTLLDSSGREYVLNNLYENLETERLEKRVKANPFVEECHISKKLNGELAVWVKLVKPIVRVWTDNQGFYLDKKGKKIPLSKKYTPYCLVLSGDNVSFDFKSNESDKKLLDLLNFITSSEIWQVHIAQVHLEKTNLKIYLQLSETEINFGTWEDWEIKMKKIELLCKNILPKKGWNKYEKVSLKYHHQIVCE